jgi:hypothetical protein
VLNEDPKLEETLMLQTALPLIQKLTLFLATAVATHFVMSFGQTFMHYKVAHHPIGGKLFRNHINFHTPTMPTIISFLRLISVTKATLPLTSLFPYF